MLSTRRFCFACAVAVFVCLLAAPVSAQLPDKRTVFTFSGAVALPGITLPAGQYVFRVADPQTSSKVVQVLNADGTKPYGLFYTLPTQRIEPAPTPEVQFMETASGMPAAIRSWWYPGEGTGYEFIFPKEQARRLAMAAAQPVLTTQAPSTKTEQTNTTELSRVAAGGQETHVAAGAAPTAATSTGGTQKGELASSSLAISTPSIPAGMSSPAATTQAPSAPTGSTQTASATATDRPAAGLSEGGGEESIPARSIAGTYRCGPDTKACQWVGPTITMTQSGTKLEMKSEKGDIVNGEVTSDISLSAGPPWNMLGIVSDDGRTLEWSNGTKWTRQ